MQIINMKLSEIHPYEKNPAPYWALVPTNSCSPSCRGRTRWEANRTQKCGDARNRDGKVNWSRVQFVFPQERPPLGDLRRGAGEFFSPGVRGNRGQRNVPSLECIPHCVAECGIIMVEQFGKEPDVVKILHSAVDDSARHHRFRFFSDCSRHRINLQPRRGMTKKRWILRQFR